MIVSSTIDTTNRKNTTQVFIKGRTTERTLYYEQQNTENSQEEIVNFMPYNKKLTDFVSLDSMGKYQTSVLLY